MNCKVSKCQCNNNGYCEVGEYDKCGKFNAYNQAIDDLMDSLKNEWTIDSILCATDKYKLLAIFKRIEEQLKEQTT